MTYPFLNSPTTIPTPSITTFNSNSLSAYGNTSSSSQTKRNKGLLSIIKSLLAISLILCIQETHLGANDKHTLGKEFPNHKILYNNHGEGGRAGTLIVVNKKLLEIYDTIEAPPTKTTKGHIQVVRFKPRRGHRRKRRSFNVVNCYVSNGEERKEQIRSLLRIHPGVINIVLGDFNFTEFREDSPSPESKLILSGVTKDDWNKVKAHLGLREIAQPIHTHYFITQPFQDCRTSRIDRIYISHTLAESSLTHPSTYIPEIPHNILGAYEIVSKAHNGSSSDILTKRSDHHISDHIPVSLLFAPLKGGSLVLG